MYKRKNVWGVTAFFKTECDLRPNESTIKMLFYIIYFMKNSMIVLFKHSKHAEFKFSFFSLSFFSVFLFFPFFSLFLPWESETECILRPNKRASCDAPFNTSMVEWEFFGLKLV